MPLLSTSLISTLLFPLLLLLTPTATAQTLIDPTILPACALPCTLLNQAQSACVPPAAPASNQATYTACFCQSAYLAPLYSSPNGVCDAFCTNPADLGRLQQWYVGLCRAGAAPGTTLSTSVVVVQGTSTSDGGAGAASATARAGTGGSGANSSGGGGGGGWFSAHWRWVLMLIIIFLAMIFFAILGLWLKRRRRRKRDANAGNVAAANAFRVPTPHPVVAAAPEMSSGTNGSVGPQFGTARSAPAPVGQGNGKGRRVG